MKRCPKCNREMGDELLFCSNDGEALGPGKEWDELIGTLLDDRYRIEEGLGKGAFGKVYLATDIHLSLKVAIKVLHPAFLSDFDAVERFRNEALTSASINHPNAIQVRDFGITKAAGITYLVMELLKGEALRDRIRELKRLGFEEAMAIVEQTCMALQAAHSKGIVHLDLKPENIWLAKSDVGSLNIKVLDFGIAKLTSLSGSNTQPEQELISGTPQYMSPEQWKGGELDARSDIYSLGIVIYEMLTGEVPFDSDNLIELMGRQVQENPKSMRQLRNDISEAVEQVILRALEKKRDDRYSSAAQLAREFTDALIKSDLIKDSKSDYDTIIISKKEMEAFKAARTEIIERSGSVSQREPCSSLPPLSPDQIPPVVSLANMTIHLKPPASMQTAEREKPAPTMSLRHPEVIQDDEQHLFEELILHKDYDRLWRSLVHATGGHNVLTGYGPFGGTTLLRCAIAKARTEIKRLGQSEGALLVFYFNIKDETKDSFNIEATNLGFSHLEGPQGPANNSDLSELKARADNSKASGVLDLTLENPIGHGFFETPDTGLLADSKRQYVNFEHFAADLNAYFKNKKTDKALRQLVLRIVRSESLPARVVFIIDRIQRIETLEALFRSQMFSNNRIRIIAVARKEDFDIWQEAEQRLSAIGFSKWYVPCIWKIDWNKWLFNSNAAPGSGAESEYKPFLMHLEYTGRGSLGNIIKELRHPRNINYGDSFDLPDLKELGERTDVLHNAWVQELLELNLPVMLGDLFGGLDQDEKIDRARIGIYILVDWIARRTRFAHSQILELSHKSSIAISDDTETILELVSKLLDLLKKSGYLEIAGDGYRVIWNKQKTRKPRTFATLQTRHLNQKTAPGISRAAPVNPAIHRPAPMPTSPDIKPASTDYSQTTMLLEPRIEVTAPLIQPGATASHPNKVFVSYSRHDETWLKLLQQHLKPLQHKNQIELWDDTQIKAGDNWREEILNAISAANAAILLVSSNFLASDFIVKDELPPLLAASEKQGTRILPVILGHCIFEHSSLARFQAVNPPSRPLSAMKKTDWEKVLAGLAKTLAALIR